MRRDFGVKPITRDLRAFVYSAKLPRDDREVFVSLCNKYHIEVESNYPMWEIERYRNKIMSLADELIDCIEIANTVYVTTEAEFNFRRQYQWKAIACCRQILMQMQLAIEDLPIDGEKLMPVVESIENEYNLLKLWKKSDNHILEIMRAKNKV